MNDEKRTDQELIVASKVRSVFSNGDGLDVLKFLMAQTGYLETNYSDGMTSMDLAFREGRRSLVSEIAQICNLDLKKVADQAIKEQGEWNAHTV